MKILVSSCLLGCKCRYDGREQKVNISNFISDDFCLIPFCPEQAGGLPTPRIPCEIVGDKIINKNGEDKTKEFVKGANEALNLCNLFNIKYAILKSKSPSCGFGKIYDGTFSNNLIKGKGITANLLNNNGIKIFNENNFENIVTSK
ncbi:MAG: DUF523 domain-containing protein [Miniphocaeibacter sp.]|uniref:DUF523 domain-containing protein n=1 Tax=Miniphocaeibacter sp. TaxID=3100973 RepID=UPI001826D02C|nr:DUF523 domain-containing protein [Gallicola sp.]